MTEYRFVNEQYEKIYHDAKRLLASECERQVAEATRLHKEWECLPEKLCQERVAWLQQHFQKCREPYIKIITDALMLATPILCVPIGSVIAHAD